MHIFIIVATSADGFIAQQTQQVSTAWTSQEDKRFFNQKTKEAGAIVMGKKTFETIGFPLPKRLNIIYTKDTKQQLADQYNLSSAQLDDHSLQVTTLEPAKLCQQLEKQGVKQLAVCGGSSIYTQFLQAQLVDKLFITVEPILFGTGIKFLNQSLNQKLILKNSTVLNDQGTTLLEYDCLK